MTHFLKDTTDELSNEAHDSFVEGHDSFLEGRDSFIEL